MEGLWCLTHFFVTFHVSVLTMTLLLGKEAHFIGKETDTQRG